ncbi:MAG: hypothetical protein JWQ84_2551 [Mucilaginibacter sp.]|nr:hypothetical protein [Mucilaginibacter sp.]
MIHLIITLINIFLLFAGIYTVVKKTSVAHTKVTTLLNSILIQLITISFLYFLMLMLKQDFTRLLILLSIVNLSAFYYTKNSIKEIFKSEPSPSFNYTRFWALSTVFFFTVYFALFSSKHGEWDAWAIWNLHAKFLYYPEIWQRLFSTKLTYTHADYPLMLPSIVAFFWRSVNATAAEVPVLLAYGVLLLIPLLVYYSLIKKGLSFYACIALAIFVIDINYKFLACAQIADSLLSLLILAVFIQYQELKDSDSDKAYILGFICASCAWVKNEGMVFYIIFTIGFLLTNIKNLQTFKKYLMGILVPTLFLIAFKVFYAPVNDLVAANSKGVSSFKSVLFNTGRYITIIKFGINMLMNNYMILLMLILAAVVFNRKFFKSFPFIIILLLLGAYFFAYLTTPYDLVWHLTTSIDRLIQQVYPALIYLILLSLREIKLNNINALTKD